MKAIDVWLQAQQRVGFYTQATSRDIPEMSGIYGWFLPLYLYHADPVELINEVHGFLRFETSNDTGVRESSAKAELNWERFDLNIKASPKVAISSDFDTEFRAMCSRQERREPFSFALMAASILMPPLYLGKADSLRQRYLQHVIGGSPTENNFHNRFTRFAELRELPVRVKDLLFVAVPLPDEIHKALKVWKLNQLLEKIVINMASPPFSIR